jgi:beta-galactosidase
LSLANTTDWMNFLTKNDHSFSIYMAHGGTSFGFWAGANTDATDGTYQPDVTSYDYDAAINEAGQPGEKFNIIRNIVKPWALWDVIDIPPIPEFI